MKLYKRIIRVVVGQDNGSAVEIEKLYMQIEIKKNLSAKPNEGFVKIYNLMKDTEARIKNKATRIRVFAGHNNEPILLHDGDIRRIESNTEGQNRVMTITLGGHILKLSQAFFDRAYAGQITVKQIVQDAVPSFGLEQSDIDQIPEDAFLYDFSFTGKTSVLLDKILNPLKIQWFENDNFISFSARGKTLKSVVELSKYSGMINSPAITYDSKTLKSTGVTFKSVLNGRIILDNRIKIESITVTGIYKISQITHRGDNREGEFVTDGVGVEIEQ